MPAQIPLVSELIPQNEYRFPIGKNDFGGDTYRYIHTFTNVTEACVYFRNKPTATPPKATVERRHFYGDNRGVWVPFYDTTKKLPTWRLSWVSDTKCIGLIHLAASENDMAVHAMKLKLIGYEPASLSKFVPKGALFWERVTDYRKPLAEMWFGS